MVPFFGHSMPGSDTSISAILGFQGVVASPCLPQYRSWKSSSAFTASGLHCALTGLSSGMKRFLRQPVRMTPSWIGSTSRRCSERGCKRKNMFSCANSGKECMLQQLCHDGGPGPLWRMLSGLLLLLLLQGEGGGSGRWRLHLPSMSPAGLPLPLPELPGFIWCWW